MVFDQPNSRKGEGDGEEKWGRGGSQDGREELELGLLVEEKGEGPPAPGIDPPPP